MSDSEESKRVTVTLSAENVAWLDAHYNNRSGYIDDLLTKAREGSGHIEDAIREFQIQQLESEVSGMEAQLDTKKARLETLRAEREAEQQQQQALLEDALDALEDAPRDPENPAIQNWAEKCDITPSQLVAELEDTDE